MASKAKQKILKMIKGTKLLNFVNQNLASWRAGPLDPPDLHLTPLPPRPSTTLESYYLLDLHNLVYPYHSSDTKNPLEPQ